MGSRKKPSYEKRIVVFIDILGFKEIVGKTVNKNQRIAQTSINKIIDAYDSLWGLWTVLSEMSEENMIDYSKPKSRIVTTFSDSIIISFKIEDQTDLYNTFAEMQILQLQLIQFGIVCRGSMVYGKLIHTDKYIFGPALIEAYEMEVKAALYPRIIISDQTIRLANRLKETPEDYVGSYKLDFDGVHYIDYFFTNSRPHSSIIMIMDTLIFDLSKIIDKGLRLKPHIRTKYTWMKEKFNSMVRHYTENKYIDQRDSMLGKLSEKFTKSFKIKN